MKINYLCNSWQYLLQQVVYMVGRGYYNYHVGTIPTDKVAKANKIDKKIIEKYKIDCKCQYIFEQKVENKYVQK